MARPFLNVFMQRLSDRTSALLRSGRRRFGRGLWIPLCVLLLLIVGAAAFLLPRIALDSEVARQTLVARLTAITGQPVSVSGTVGFSLLPRTQLVVDRVRIGNASSTSIDRIVADLDPVDALMGSASISRLVLVRPEYRGDRPDTSPTAGVGVGAAAPNRSAAGAIRGPLSQIKPLLRVFLQRFRGLEVLEIRDGVLRPDPAGNDYGFSNANLTVTQSGPGATMNIDGSFIWNGEPTDIDAVIDAPERLVADGSSDIDLTIGSPALDTHFTGSVSLSRDNTIAGRLQMSVASLGRSLEWLGDPKGRVPDIGPISLDADLLLAGSEAALSDLNVTVAGSVGRGAVEASFRSAKPTIGGTLAFPSLDLTPLARSVAPLPSEAYDFDRPIDLAFADELQLDLRLSAVRASLGNVGMADMAAVVSLSGGALKVNIGDATLFGGRGRANLVLDGRPGRSEMASASGDMALYGVDTAQMMTAMNVDSLSVGGRSNVKATMTALIRDWRTVARNVRIDTQIEASNGAISGFDPAVFASPGARPLSQGFSGSRVPFRSLKADLRLSGETVQMDSLRIVNSGGELLATGRFMPIGRDMAIGGEFKPIASTAVPSPAASAEKIAFALEGKWPDPSVTTTAATDAIGR